MPGLALVAGDLVERRRVLGGLARKRQRLAMSGGATGGRPVHVEVAFDLTPLLCEQHRKKEARAQQASYEREQARACARPEGPNGTAVLGEQLRPDLDMTVLHLRQTTIEILLLRVRFGVGEQTVEVRSIRLVLPMVLERVQVRSRRGLAMRGL